MNQQYELKCGTVNGTPIPGDVINRYGVRYKLVRKYKTKKNVFTDIMPETDVRDLMVCYATGRLLYLRWSSRANGFGLTHSQIKPPRKGLVPIYFNDELWWAEPLMAQEEK